MILEILLYHPNIAISSPSPTIPNYPRSFDNVSRERDELAVLQAQPGGWLDAVATVCGRQYLTPVKLKVKLAVPAQNLETHSERCLASSPGGSDLREATKNP